VSAFVHAIISRRRCADVAEIIGTPRIVMHKVLRRMARARKPARVTMIHLDGGFRITGERWDFVAAPRGVRS
jgi:hypothetical protein